MAQPKDHPNRDAILTAIQASPGISQPALRRQLGISRSNAAHHLSVLIQRGSIRSILACGRLHYFSGSDSIEFAFLQDPRRQRIATYIANHPGASQTEVSEVLAIPISRVHGHMKVLQTCGLIEARTEGRCVRFSPTSRLASLALDQAPPGGRPQ